MVEEVNEKDAFTASTPSNTPTTTIAPKNTSNGSNNSTEEIILSLPWPEEEERQSIVRRCINHLFYSYMSGIFSKGSQLHKQRKNRIRQREGEGGAGTGTGGESSESSESSSSSLDANNNNHKELSHNDLFQAPKMMHSDHLIDKFHSTFTKMKMEMETETPRERRWMFMKTLWTLSKPTYIPAGIYQLVTVLVQALSPIIVQRLLRLFEENPNSSLLYGGGGTGSSAVLYAVALFLCSIIDGIAQEKHKYQAYQSGIVVRAATVNAIYDHMLQLSAEGKQNLLSGEATNLVAIDSQKLFEVLQEGHLIWSCPLSMVIVTILLLLTLGKATLVGMVSMILMVPFVKMVVTNMMSIRRKRARYTDKRVEVTSSMLQAIRFCKLNHYEEKFVGRVNEARKAEMYWVRRELSMFGWTMSITVLTPVIASALTFITYSLMEGGKVLTSSQTFTTLLLFSVLRFPINYVGKLIGKAAQGIEACQRIANFLHRDISNDIVKESMREKEERSTEKDMHVIEIEYLLSVENGNFTVGGGIANGEEENNDTINMIESPPMSKEPFTVSDINFRVKKSEILAIVGPVASGKSTLINALIGDVPLASNKSKNATKITMQGRVAYASQQPFILNSSFRDNILFGSEYKEDLYNRVIDACNLLPDLKQLGAAGDLTEIGERGVTLSGGQKARISIARCVYSQPSVAIFDDVLSALDASTGKWIFDRLFDTSTNKERLLSNCATLLVTHASHFLSRVDQIMVLVKGKAVYLGDWNGLQSGGFPDLDAREVIQSLRSSVQEGHSELEDSIHPTKGKLSTLKKPLDIAEAFQDDEDNLVLMTVEEREFGLSEWKTWLKWFKYAGGICFFLSAFISLAIDRGFYVIVELWLAFWTAAAHKDMSIFGLQFVAQSEGFAAQVIFVRTYAIILGISFLSTILRSQIIIQGGANCANKMFHKMIQRVIKAPMFYFETTPTGRILNRLTYDVETVDISLSQSMTILLISTGWFVTGVVLQLSILPYCAAIFAPVLVLYWALLLYYRKSAVDLQRLDAVSRSPVQAKLAEGMDGCTTIRAFGQISNFQNHFKATVDSNTAAMMNFMAAQRWLGARFQVLGSLVVLFSSIFVVAFNDWLRLETGIIAMLLIWSSNFTITLGFFSQAVSETEAYLTSIERMRDMTKLPQENDHETSELVKLKSSWPNQGKLSFDNVCLRYRPGLPYALNGLTFIVSAGERIGVVGRTGAGKSTIAAALFRLCELESGNITLDGQNLSELGLGDVRGRKNGMSIIPQDPVLFSGSLRECLDPWGQSKDDEILEALQAVQVANAEKRGLTALDDFVDEGGRNFSVGERQLLCLARAVLAKPRLLVLDEATASVDGDTDAFIQQMIRKRFVNVTMITIAHRLNTIMDYDRILVMDEGKAVEFDTPVRLLEDDNGLFTNLVDSTGKESSRALRAMAKTTSR